jgi:outer membrane protein TolC
VQDARFQQRVARYQLTVLTAAQEVEDALIGYLKTREQVSFREAASAASQRAAELALSQYRNGRVSFVVVLEALDRLARDQDRLTTARGDAARHLISAYKALGGGWENPPQGPYVSDAARTAMQDRTDWGDLLEASAP